MYSVLCLDNATQRSSEYSKTKCFTVERQVGTPLFLKNSGTSRVGAVANGNHIGGSYAPDFQGSDN